MPKNILKPHLPHGISRETYNRYEQFKNFYKRYRKHLGESVQISLRNVGGEADLHKQFPQYIEPRHDEQGNLTGYEFNRFGKIIFFGFDIVFKRYGKDT